MKSNPSASSAQPAATPAPLRVLVVDDHAPTLAAVAAILDEEFPLIDVIGVAGDGETAIRIARDDAPDVIVLDLDLGGEYGLDLMPALMPVCGVAWTRAVVVLTSADNPAERLRAKLAGASAFVSKLAPVQELVAAILASRNNPDGYELCHGKKRTNLPVK